MKIIKTLKRWGSGLAIYFGKHEAESMGFNEGDKIDISDLVKLKQRREKEDENTNKKKWN